MLQKATLPILIYVNLNCEKFKEDSLDYLDALALALSAY